MRDVSRLGDWMQIVSNLGLIVGLALVALQMRQASEIASAELSSQYYLQMADAYGVASGDDLPAAWARAQMNAPDLTDAELSAVKYFLLRQWLMSARQARMSEKGFDISVVDPAFVQGWVNTLGNETALRWWNAERDRALAFDPTFRDAVDARLHEVGPALREAHRRLLEEMRSGALPGVVAREPR
jgi:hypothetical protein